MTRIANQALLRGLYCAVCGEGEWTGRIGTPLPQVTDRWGRHIDDGHVVMALTTAEYVDIFGVPGGSR